ncbi:glycine/D-amino acid oxidase-like deaminating enzyme [Pontibacter ummariensis]|uniref:Glycine/D-amino acid oxidase n=1 Tax=Pontibacter ummariensis TaxID=1610492 RepID=A0A239BGE7_9BACT|nr:FAD-dependent oxidoreductase [Pontibacter ummariensis]PRY16514.1 glycine/D-amino acid oxidase-like deaminating enzyme [Pontibacter ummariensis]SNS06521.1 Glycine/D-amino acid oxidase [Pontibacter ummariensis]
MQLSYWERDSYFSNIDVLIVGSGIVGLNAALHLKKTQPKLKVMVVERGLLPTGASSKNAGFACFGSPSELLEDLAHLSEEAVFQQVARRWKGLQRLRQNLGDQAIDYHRWGGYELFEPHQHELYEQCQEALPYLNKQLEKIMGEPNVYRPADEKIASFGFKGVKRLIESIAEGQIDTGRMILALTQKVQAEGVLVLNGIEVLQLQDNGKGIAATTAQGLTIEARAALVATNGFARKLLPQLSIVPARAQVLITEPIPGLKLKGTFHYDKGYYYFRNVGNRVLFGGGRNLDIKAEETTEFGLTAVVQQRLEELLRQIILPDTPFEVAHRWSGIMGMGAEKTTIVQKVSERISCSIRLSGMGIAIGSLVGEEGAALVLQQL